MMIKTTLHNQTEAYECTICRRGVSIGGLAMMNKKADEWYAEHTCTVPHIDQLDFDNAWINKGGYWTNLQGELCWGDPYES